MNTLNSEKRIDEFKSASFQSKRKTWTFSWLFRSTPEKIFPLLCATREADWLEGSTHKLIFTNSGLSEKDYIFQSDFFGVGEEIWVRFEHVENESLAYYRFSENVIIKFEIKLTDNKNGTVETLWSITYTSIKEEGNSLIKALPEKMDLSKIMRSLQYYMDNGEPSWTQSKEADIKSAII